MSTKLATVIADFTTQLTTLIPIGGTTATLASATDDDGVALPTGTYFFTLDGGNGQKEHIVCSLNGTALTNIQSVSRQGVETSGAARLHRVGASVTITDYAHLYFLNQIAGGLALLDADHPLEYDGAANITGVNQLTTLAKVLTLVNGGPVSLNQISIAGTAGETFSAGAPVYLKASDGRWYKALGNNQTLYFSNAIKFGIALGSGSAGVSITGGVAVEGLVSTLSGLTANNLYYISDTGTLATTPGTYVIPFGWSLSTTSLVLGPTLQNKFVTLDSVYNADTDQSQLTQNATVEVGEANATLKKNQLAQSFIPSKTKIRGVTLFKSANTGTFTGTVTISLQADSSGSPSGSDLASVTISNAAYLALATGAQKFIFSSEYTSLVPGSTYWIVITTSTSDTSNHPNLGTNSAGGYGNGSVKYKNTTDGWVAIATIDLYFATLQGITGQIQGAQIGVLPVVNGGTNRSSSTQIYKSGVVAITNANGTQNIAHGMGVVPVHIKITFFGTSGTVPGIHSFGTYDGANTACVEMVCSTNATPASSTSEILRGQNGSSSISSVATMDATNIILATAIGNGGIAGYMLWEAWGI